MCPSCPQLMWPGLIQPPLAVAGVQGLCLGILLGAAATNASFFFLMWQTDWDLEADKAADRAVVKPAQQEEGDTALQHITSTSESDGSYASQHGPETMGLLAHSTQEPSYHRELSAAKTSQRS